MLGKLIKFDLKSTSHSFVPVYIALAVLAAMMIFCSTVIPDDLNDYATATTSTAAVLYGLSTSVFTLLAFLIPVMRFKKCVLTDEGYLMLTIPVSPWMHVVSKLICAVVWYIVSRLCKLAMSGLLLIAYRDELSSADDITFSKLDSEQIVSLIMDFIHPLMFIIFAQLFLYMIFILSSASLKNRGVLSILLSILGISVMGFLYSQFITFVEEHFVDDMSFFTIFGFGGTSDYYICNCIFFAVFSVIFYVVTTLFMSRKYNLQ